MRIAIFLILISLANVSLVFSQETDTIKAKQFEQKANELFELFKYDSAASNYSQAAKIYEKYENWFNCVKNYRLTADCFVQLLKVDTALYFSERAYGLANTNFLDNSKKENFERVNVILILGKVKSQLGDYKQELFLCEKALELAIKTDSLDKLKIAEVWNKIGISYFNTSQQKKAVKYCEKSLVCRQKFLDENHIDIAESLFNLGYIYARLGSFANSIKYFERALKIRTEKLNQNAPSIADVYEELGHLYLDVGNIGKANEFAELALQINKLNFGVNSPKLGKIYWLYARMHKLKGDFDKALEYDQNALLLFCALQHPLFRFSNLTIGLV